MPDQNLEQRGPDQQVVLAGFGGLILNADPNDLKDGQAQKQVNVTSVIPGQLKLRYGYRQVTFENL